MPSVIMLLVVLSFNLFLVRGGLRAGCAWLRTIVPWLKVIDCKL
jgi:hypothetical protein